MQFKGNVARYAASHTTSRVLQAAVKAAPAAARAAVAAEVGDDLLTLSKSSYGHFLVRKLVALAPQQVGARRIGHLGLFRREHAQGAWPQLHQYLLHLPQEVGA